MQPRRDAAACKARPPKPRHLDVIQGSRGHDAGPPRTRLRATAATSEALWRTRYVHFAALHQLDEVVEQDVSVPLAESLGVVGHLWHRERDRLSDHTPVGDNKSPATDALG